MERIAVNLLGKAKISLSRFIVEMWTLRMLNVKAQKQANNRKLLYKDRNVATILPPVMWKVESMPEGGDLTKETSKQSIEGATTVSFSCFSKMQEKNR